MPKRGETMSDEQKRKIAAALRERTPPTKECPRCGQVKARTEFGVRKNGYSRSRCRACERADWVKWQKANPHKVKVSNRRTGLRRHLGLTEQDYLKLRTSQGALCAICRRSETEVPKGRLHVDHSHESGLIRGLLCSPCNTAIGLLREDADALLAAVAYLAEPPAAQYQMYAEPGMPSGGDRTPARSRRVFPGQGDLFEVIS